MCNNIWYTEIFAVPMAVQSSAKDIKISVSDFMWQVSLFLYGGPPTSNDLWSLFAILRLLFIHPSKLFVGHFCPQLCGNPIIFLFSIRKLAALIASGAVSRRSVCAAGLLLYFISWLPTLTKGTRTNFVGHQFRTGWIISDTQIALAIYKNYLPQSFTMAVEANWSERGATPHWHVLNECRPRRIRRTMQFRNANICLYKNSLQRWGNQNEEFYCAAHFFLFAINAGQKLWGFKFCNLFKYFKFIC